MRQRGSQAVERWQARSYLWHDHKRTFGVSTASHGVSHLKAKKKKSWASVLLGQQVTSYGSALERPKDLQLSVDQVKQH